MKKTTWVPLDERKALYTPSDVEKKLNNIVQLWNHDMLLEVDNHILTRCDAKNGLVLFTAIINIDIDIDIAHRYCFQWQQKPIVRTQEPIVLHILDVSLTWHLIQIIDHCTNDLLSGIRCASLQRHPNTVLGTGWVRIWCDRQELAAPCLGSVYRLEMVGQR